MKVCLISPYEIGRQPFALAQPAAWFKQHEFEVDCIDLSVEPFEIDRISDAKLVAIHLAMHTGARLASKIIPRIAQALPNSIICAYGLYAPVNEAYLRSLGVSFIFGGESEPDLLALGESIRNGMMNGGNGTSLRFDKIDFMQPLRSALPSLDQYSKLALPDGTNKNVGFVEASRGCKHLCRHCPVVPVYKGKFRVVQMETVMSDVRQQIEMGAEHISFGDPDFLNGPTHARRIVSQLNSEFPCISWDATIKIEHLLKHADLIREFATQGCLLITTAVESIENRVLERLDKGHTAKDFTAALLLTRSVGIHLAPTFVPFTPWTTLEGYRKLLETIVELNLVYSVAPVQLSIRLLLPAGSTLLESPDRQRWLRGFDAEMLGYNWVHPDQKVDELQKKIQLWVGAAEQAEYSRRETFTRIWQFAHESLGVPAPELAENIGVTAPHMTEPWYCCAEPTDIQFEAYS